MPHAPKPSGPPQVRESSFVSLNEAKYHLVEDVFELYNDSTLESFASEAHAVSIAAVHDLGLLAVPLLVRGALTLEFIAAFLPQQLFEKLCNQERNQCLRFNT